MSTHLRTKHQINLEKRKATPKSSVTPISTPAVPEEKVEVPEKAVAPFFLISDPTKVVISRMIASDGIPMRTFATSTDLRRLMSKSGHTVPKSPNDVRNIVMGYCREVREKYTKEMQDALADGELFSITMDEWTSLSNKKYMNVNIHSTRGRVWCLGLARVKGSAPSETCRKIMEDVLIDFNLTLDNIVSVTTDGAKIMKKMGREIGPDHQVCFAHGLHLAVCDVLYKKKPAQADTEDAPTIDDEPEEEDLEQDLNEGFSLATTPLPTEHLTTTNQVGELINKVRSVVVIFKRSASKTDDIFNKFLEDGDNRKLLLDCKTRWNSLVIMIKRF